MAFFIPSEFNQDYIHQSELAVFQELEEHLSANWFVFHSYDFLTRDLHNQLWDGEIDFLLYRPDLGFLILEVKGGSISCENGQWYQDGRPIEPVEQAKHNKYAIMRLIKQHYGHDVPLRFAHALCFPACSKAKATVWPPDAKDIIVYLSDLKNIDTLAEGLILQAPLPHGCFGDVPDSQEILDILSPEFDYHQLLSKSILDNIPLFNILTRQQEAIIEVLQDFTHLQFIGAAGTGKTYLAIQKARQIAENGGQALLLCFNELLAKKIQNLTWGHGYKGSITVRAFFNFCVELMNIPQEDYDRHRRNPLLYSKVLPDFLGRYLDQNPVTYDAVIVDEAQDFSPQIWKLIPRLVGPYGHFYVFYDPAQNIFRDELHLPDFGLPPIRLTRNCRNTQKIIQALQPLSELPLQPMPHTPTGSDVIVRHGSDGRQLLLEELDRLVQVERVNYSDIVILAGHSLAHTCLGDQPTLGNYTIVEQPKAGLPGGSIRFYTYMKFKGCEASIIILLDVDAADPRWNDTGLYTAMSRAMHQLIILRKD